MGRDAVARAAQRRRLLVPEQMKPVAADFVRFVLGPLHDLRIIAVDRKSAVLDRDAAQDFGRFRQRVRHVVNQHGRTFDAGRIALLNARVNRGGAACREKQCSGGEGLQ